jgi:hypothetical protein
MFGWAGRCLVIGFYEVYLNFGVAQVGPDNIWLKGSICG